MTTPHTLLPHLRQTRRTLAGRGNDAVLADYDRAIALTEQALAGQIEEAAWRAALAGLAIDWPEESKPQGQAGLTVGSDKVGGDKVAGDRITQHTGIDQRGQTVQGDQYNAGRDVTINQAPEPSPGPPNTRLWRWLVAAGIVVALLAGVVSIFSDSFNVISYLATETPTTTATSTATHTPTPTNTPTITPTPSPSPTPLPFPPATGDETLIVIATFHETGATKTEPHTKIRRDIEEEAEEVGLDTLRVEEEPTIINADGRAAAEALGNQYNASMIIWGEVTGVQVLVNFLNLKQPEFFAAQSRIDERQRTPTVDPGAYAEFILEDLPEHVTFLSMYAVAQSFLKNKQYEQARNLLTRSISKVKDISQDNKNSLAEAYNQLGWIYLEPLSDSEKALDNLEKAIDLNPELTQAYYNRGIALSRLGHYEQALIDLNTYIEPDSEDAWAYYIRGDVYAKLGDFDRALDDLNKAVSLSPEIKWFYNLRGDIYSKQEIYDLALQDLDKALDMDPEFFWAYYIRANVYRMQENYPSALKDFDIVFSLDPTYSWAYYNRGNTYEAMKRFDDALLDYTRAISYNPKLAWAYYLRANIHAEHKNNPAAAITDFEQGLAVETDTPPEWVEERLAELKSQQNETNQ